MDWLITVKADADLEQLRIKLTAYGCEIARNLAPIPLEDNEQVIEIVGPSDLPQKVAGDDSILGVFPNSELTLFDDV